MWLDSFYNPKYHLGSVPLPNTDETSGREWSASRETRDGKTTMSRSVATLKDGGAVENDCPGTELGIIVNNHPC